MQKNVFLQYVVEEIRDMGTQFMYVCMHVYMYVCMKIHTVCGNQII